MPKQKWNRRHLAVRAIAAGAAFVAIGIVAAFGFGYILGLGTSSSTTSQDRGVAVENGAGPAPAPMPPCDEVEPEPISFLGRLAPGFTVIDLLGQGYAAATAINGFDEDLIVLSEDAQTVAAAEANPALAVTGWMRSRSMDVSLRSCYYRLDDKPAAVQIANRATAWMVTNGVLTQAQINAGGTTFGLTDDPTNPAHLFFSVILATPGGGQPGTDAAGSLTEHVAVVDKASGLVLGAGRAHW